MFSEFDGIGDEVLSGWAESYNFTTVAVSTVDFVKAEVESPSVTKQAFIVPSDKEQLRVENIDWSLEYVDIFILNGSVDIKSRVVYNGKKFSVIARADYSRYGFQPLIGEEIK